MGMTTRDKIEVMDAYEKDGILERCLKGSMDWERIVEPVWNWEKYVYRIIPKKRKFEEGDKVVEKDAQKLPLEGENDNYIWTVKGYTQEGEVEFKGGVIIPENQACEEYVKIDDALWYWEYRDENGKWKMTFERSTVDGLNLNVTDAYCELSTATPIYALGFRLPDD
jgi:hypothetical protein|nr:MAG TPA: hypothetical protein [Caudoviricetes sp.]